MEDDKEFERDTGVPIGWLVEKSERACRDAARLVDKVNQLKISKDDRTRLYRELDPLLYNLTKIVAHVNDATKVWKPDVSDNILETGMDGFKVFMSRVREFSDGYLKREHMIKGSMDEPI